MTDAHTRIDTEVKSNDVVLFMKGTPQFPMCGFSGQVVQILNYLGVPFKGVNVLEDQDLRQGVKDYSNWPTVPPTPTSSGCGRSRWSRSPSTGSSAPPATRAGWRCGSRAFCDALVNLGRAYLFSTSIPPFVAAAAEAAVGVMRDEPQRQGRVRQSAARVRGMLGNDGLAIPAGDSPIVPVILGEEVLALEAAERLLSAGILVPAIRPPTVPVGTSRLRVSLSAAHSFDDLARLEAALIEASEAQAVQETEQPPRSLRSLPPEGAAASLGAARREAEQPPRSLRSLPPEGAAASLGAARRETAA